ncbi:MAG: hypothetical protein M0R46_16480 [Candidatus Muirbacterium halophilum]|nr:hypothetical protein [Candidatus Muirbacterium halophilum]
MEIKSIYREKFDNKDQLIIINTDEKGLNVNLINNLLTIYNEDIEKIYELDITTNLSVGEIYIKYYNIEKEQIQIYLKYYNCITNSNVETINFKLVKTN